MSTTISATGEAATTVPLSALEHDTGIWVFISTIHTLGVSVLAIFLAIRIRLDDFRSFQNLRQISRPRLFLVLQYLSSWLFIFAAGILQQGVRLYVSRETCSAGIYLSLALYSLSKLFLYLFLAERVYVVWCPTMAIPRLKSPIYLLCTATIFAYSGIICHMFVVNMSHLTEAGRCFIGVRLDGVIMLVAFDVFISVLLTTLFIWPLYRNRFMSAQLKRITRRSVTAAFITLTTSCVNISVLASRGGIERGWVLFSCWEGDLLVGASALYWLTSGTGLRPTYSMAHEEQYQEPYPRKRKWYLGGRRANSTLSFIAGRPDALRRSSLPTIMTHGAASMDDRSDNGSVLTLPRAASLHGQPPWPHLLSAHRMGDGDFMIAEHDDDGIYVQKDGIADISIYDDRKGSIASSSSSS